MIPTTRPNVDPANGVFADLCFTERLVLWSLRLWTDGPNNWRRVERQLRAVCGGGDALIALGALSGIVCAIETDGRRALGLRRAESPAVSADERALLGLIAAAQGESAAHVRALLRWLLAGGSVTAVADHARRFAMVLTAAGMVVPQRTPRAPLPQWPGVAPADAVPRICVVDIAQRDA